MKHPDKISMKSKMISNSFDQIINREVNSAGITAVQGATLNYLTHLEDDGSPAPCQHDIETRFNITHPTATGILQRLAEKGFVEFRPDESDRRMKRIFLLPKGRALTSEIRQKMANADEKLLKGLSDDELKTLHTLLDKVIANIHENKCSCTAKGGVNNCSAL